MNYWNAVKANAKSMFTFEGKTPRAEFGYWLLTIWIVANLLSLALIAAGSAVQSAVYWSFIAIFMLAITVRRRRDTGMPVWTLALWVVPLLIVGMGAATGSLTPKPIPSVDPRLGDMGPLVLLSPQVMNAAATATSNALNQLMFVVIPQGIVFILTIYELVVGFQKTKTVPSE